MKLLDWSQIRSLSSVNGSWGNFHLNDEFIYLDFKQNSMCGFPLFIFTRSAYHAHWSVNVRYNWSLLLVISSLPALGRPGPLGPPVKISLSDIPSHCPPFPTGVWGFPLVRTDASCPTYWGDSWNEVLYTKTYIPVLKINVLQAYMWRTIPCDQPMSYRNLEHFTAQLDCATHRLCCGSTHTPPLTSTDPPWPWGALTGCGSTHEGGHLQEDS